MRLAVIFSCFAVLISSLQAQQPGAAPAQAASAPTLFSEDLKQPAVLPEARLKHMFEEKIEAEWAAIKNQNRKAYGDLLADDYEGVGIDGKGERNKIQSINDLDYGNVANYTLWGFKLIPLDADSALAIYEVTMMFPPKSAIRFSRVYITELWMKRADEWKIVHYQETHVK
jgi:hypothetical protein